MHPSLAPAMFFSVWQSSMWAVFLKPIKGHHFNFTSEQESSLTHLRPQHVQKKQPAFRAYEFGILGYGGLAVRPCVCLAAHSCLTLCDHMDYSPPGSSVHGILQARILEWVAISSSRGSS